MTRALPVARGVGFCVAFLAGLALVWNGLAAVVFGGAGTGRGFLSLGVGFAAWVVLGAVAGAGPGRPEIGDRS